MVIILWSDRYKFLLMYMIMSITSIIANNSDNEETDGQSSRKILGSSVVTSVSVVMETGNGKHTYFSDAVGHPLSKPNIASQVASPINLLNPDRYEFYTFNDDGELVKRLMTLKEIQGIIAGGDGEASNYNSEYHAQVHHPENDVSGVVENVQNVLKEEMEAHKDPMEDRPIMDTPDVSSSWNLILPAFFGGDTITVDEIPNEKYVSRINPLSDTTERMNITKSTTESKIMDLPSTYFYHSTLTENTKPIPITITTEKDKYTSNILQTKATNEIIKDIYIYDGNKIDASTEFTTEEVTNTPKIMSDITERINQQNNDELFTQTVEYPKQTELVSMLTRFTTKAGEKTTLTSVTFPPSTQFTNTVQISKTSATEQPVSTNEKYTEMPPLTTTDNIKDNSIIFSLNSSKNNNVEQKVENKTVQMNKNVSMEQLHVNKYDVITNVEQIIENTTNNDLGVIFIQEYNVTNDIQELLQKPDLNKSVTLASSIIDSNKLTTTEQNLLTLISLSTELPTTQKQDITTTSLTTPSTTATKTTKTPVTTTQKIITTSLPQVKEHIKTTYNSTSVKNTTIPLSITSTQSTTQNINNYNSSTTSITIEKTTLKPITDKIISTTNTTPRNIPSSTTTQNSQLTSTIQNIINTTLNFPTTKEIQLHTTTEQPTTEKTTQNIIKLNTTTTTEKNSPSTIKINVTRTTEKVATELMTTLPTISSTTTMTTTPEKTTASLETLVTNSSFFFTTNKPNLTISTVHKIIQPFTSTTKDISSMTTSTTFTSTTTSTTSVPTTIETLNISEPYRKTEDLIPNKIMSDDTWKLVDTVKPPENKIQTTTTSKSIFEYQQPPKVDLSTQGNFGIPSLSEDMFMFSKLYNELALKFWNSLSMTDINSERSAVVSPFGAISILAMIFLGARGGTSGEMNDVLKLDDIVTFNPHLVFKEVTESIITRKAASAIVRELYTDHNKGKVLEFYKERVRQFYDGHVEEVDFKKIHNVIRRRTNALISKQTRGQLPQYLGETTLSLRPPLSALSTNIFQGDCSQASTEGRDGELYFIVLPSIRQRRLVPIPAAVWRTGFIAGYDPELDATAVSLGKSSQAISTIFVMPGQQGHSAPGDVLLRLEARLLNTTYMPEIWTQLLKSMLPRPGLEIQLPRFLHKSVINTTDALKKMGLKEMFNRHKADLRGLNGIAHDFYFSDILQVNEFSVCEESQEMHTEIYPSMTEHLENPNDQMRNFKFIDYFEDNEYDKYLSIPLSLRPRQARLPEIPRLRFDRPFLYFVRHNPTGLILHMGRFNPRLLT